MITYMFNIINKLIGKRVYKKIWNTYGQLPICKWYALWVTILRDYGIFKDEADKIYIELPTAWCKKVISKPPKCLRTDKSAVGKELWEKWKKIPSTGKMPMGSSNEFDNMSITDMHPGGLSAQSRKKLMEQHPEMAGLIENHLLACTYNHSDGCGFLWDLSAVGKGELSQKEFLKKY